MPSKEMHEIEALAASILINSGAQLQRLGFATSMPPVPIVEICLLRGLSVNSQVNLRYEDTKLAGMLNALQRAVYYEARDILGRQHFSIAHELGHLEIHWPEILHKYQREGMHDIDGHFVDLEDTFARYLKGDETGSLQSGLLFRVEGQKHIVQNPQMETQANYFAQFILLPEYLVREAAQATMGLPYPTAKHVLAHQFEVSDTAMDLRLKQLGLLPEIEHFHEHKFFSDLGRSNGSHRNTQTNDITIRTITVTPQSRLRALVAQFDQPSESADQIILDFSTFRGSDLSSFGVPQAVELALLHDHILDEWDIESEKPIRSVCCVLPDLSNHIVRHMGRLGLSSYLGIDNKPGQYLVDPQAVVSGNHVLLKVTPINNNTDFHSLALHIKNQLLEWTQDVPDLTEYADLTARITVQLVQDVVLYSSGSHGCGSGYAAVELQGMYFASEQVGYRLLLAVGDTGIPLVDRLLAHFDMNLPSTYDAIEAYCSDQSERAALIREITLHGGYLQINSGDVTHHIGRGSKNFFTELHEVPGLQITAVITVPMEQGKSHEF